MNRTNLIYIFLVFFVSGVFAPSAARDIKDNPGYVDFSEISIFKEQQPNIEVTLREPILKLLFALSRNWMDDEEKELLRLLEHIVIREYSTDPELVEKVVEFMNEKSTELEKKGWERIVRVREEDEQVDIYFRLSDDEVNLNGITVMAIEDRDTTHLINVAGNFNPQYISEISQKFNIRYLEGRGSDWDGQ